MRRTTALNGVRPHSYGRRKEVLEHLPAVLGQERLGMELHALDRQLAVPDGHDLSVVGGRRDVEHRGQAPALDRERVIARGVEWRGNVFEYAPLVVDDRRQFAVHHPLRADDPRAERLADRLVTETHAQNRNLAGEAPNEWNGDPRFARRARSRGNHDLLGTKRIDLVERDRVV